MLGRLATGLLSEDLGRGLDAAVELLREATGADDCEIWLCEPEGRDLVLAACCGPDREALLERTRFQLGLGFPGIAAATGAPCWTRRLDRDPRFLRRGLPQRGVASFLTVPLRSPVGPLGSVSLAWHQRHPPLERATELLLEASVPLGAAVRSGLLAARALVDQAADDAGPEPTTRAQACLRTIVATAGARGGALALYPEDSSTGLVVSTIPPVDPCAGALDGRLRCGLLRAGHGVALDGPRAEWPDDCRCLPPDVVAPICLPLRVEGRLGGVVVLDRPAVPVPPSRDLVTLLTMAAESSTRLALVRPRGPVQDTVPHAAGPVLEIRCLGGFEIRRDGQPIPVEAFVRRKALTLLKLLILSGGNPVSRDALAERLWPGVGGRTGANRLHGVLHALRSAIEPFREQRRWIYVCNIAELYYFNTESPHWVDLYAFQRRIATAREAERCERRDEAIQLLESALELYRGDLFADEPYAGWCELDRAELRHRYVDLTARVAALWTAAGAPDRAVPWLRRGLVADPLREDLHQHLMRVLMCLGRRDEVLAQYDVCARLLKVELGADPLPETRRLVRLAAVGPASPPPSSEPVSRL